MDTFIFILIGLVGGGAIGYIVHARRKRAIRPGDQNAWSMFYETPGIPAGPEVCRRLAVGAILSESNGFPINAIRPGQRRAAMRDWLSESWAITSTEEMEAQLVSLVEHGHSVIFDDVLSLPTGMPADEKLAYLSEGYGAATPAAHKELEEFVVNAEQCRPDLIKLGYVDPDHSLMIRTLAWDIGRATTITRVGLGAGYLTEKRAREWTERIADQASQTFNSWEEFAASYMLGRAVWGGVNHPSFQNMHEITQHLLTHKVSPWVRFGWFDAA